MTDVTARLGSSLADRYTIERELGAGGMATVYLAEDLKHERRVALKVLKPELAAVLGADRFVQEIKTTASLQHPHILPLFDSGQADGFLYYVMPYVEGETLRDKLDRETQLGIEEAIRITTEVADALDYAHRQGVVHRDIAPVPVEGYEFIWVDRDGSVEPVAAGWRINGLVRRGFDISPDGSRLTLTAKGSEPGSEDVWVKELPNGPMVRLTFGEEQAWGPRWVGDGGRITYTVGRTGSRAVLSRRADGSGAPDTVLSASGGTVFTSTLDGPDAQLSPDGEWLVVRAGVSGGRKMYIAAARVGPNATSPEAIVGGEYNATQPALSPDGRFLAYTSDETGRDEVYVRPFPDVSEARWPISTDGGIQPKWSHDGSELFYVSGAGDLMAVQIDPTQSFRVLTRQRLFTIPPDYFGLRSRFATNYDVTRDGQRFLMARLAEDRASGARSPPLVLVQNWIEELNQAVGR